MKLLNSQLGDQARRIEEQQQKLEEANERLHSQATHDGLTGLKNHRAFKERLNEEIRRAARQMLALTLIMSDVDSFKSFNDTFGHPAGDEALRQVAHLLREPLRASDFVARYGGEEFAILLPNTEAEAALDLTERLRSNIETAIWPQRTITASFGVSTLRPRVSDQELGNANAGTELLQAADVALYHSKGNGRNQVTHKDDIGG